MAIATIRLAIACLAVATTLAPTSASVAEEVDDGFRWRPGVGWKHGGHAIDLFLKFRYRWEDWNARAPQSDSFSGFRTRFGASYRFEDTLEVLAEAQQTSVLSLSAQSSGAGANYFVNSDLETDPHSIHLKRLFVDWRPDESLQLKGGRQDLNMGSWVHYEDPDWRWVKSKRMASRLVGTVDWTNVTRSYDGGLARVRIGDHELVGFAAQPTQGVFAINEAFEFLNDVVVGGLEWTARPGVLVDGLDLTAFFTGYNDSRPSTRIQPGGRVVSSVTVYTFGGSVLGIFDLGRGRLDAMLWGAYQFGDFPDRSGAAGRPTLSHGAGALLAEFGYRLPDVHGTPWLRTGVNFATGDDNPADGRHGTFFNQLPTNHGYYGLVDQLAFQNLVDWLVQLRWSPIEKVDLEVVGHGFWLADPNDSRYFGTGAFKHDVFGFGATPSGGSQDVGWELDVVLSYSITKQLALAGGYGQLFGGGVFAGTPNGGDVQWGFLQLSFSY